MARTRRSLDERIEEQEQVVSKAREHYESEVNKLEQLMNKRDELQKKELILQQIILRKSISRFWKILRWKFLVWQVGNGFVLMENWWQMIHEKRRLLC